jgi:hypothetical protein
MAFHGETIFKTDVRRGDIEPFTVVYHNMHFSGNRTYGDDGLKKTLYVRNVTKKSEVTKKNCVEKFKTKIHVEKKFELSDNR